MEVMARGWTWGWCQAPGSGEGEHLKVPDDDDRHVVGMVPLLVERSHGVGRYVLDDGLEADRHAVGVLGALMHELPQRLHRASTRAALASPLLHDGAALALQILHTAPACMQRAVETHGGDAGRKQARGVLEEREGQTVLTLSRLITSLNHWEGMSEHRRHCRS